MHHLLAVLGLATALVAPPTRRQTTRLRGTSLAKKGDDYIFEDIAKNLGKGDQDRLYQYQLELAERYGEDKIGRAAPPPKPKKPKQGAAVVVAALRGRRRRRRRPPSNATPNSAGAASCAAPWWRCSWLPGFGVLDIRPDEGARPREVAGGAHRGRGGAGDGRSLRCVRRRRARLRVGLRLRRAAAAAGAYGAAAPACAKACSSVGGVVGLRLSWLGRGLGIRWRFRGDGVGL